MQHTASLVSLAVLGSASLLKTVDDGIEPEKPMSNDDFFENIRKVRFIDNGIEIWYPFDWDRALLMPEGEVNVN